MFSKLLLAISAVVLVFASTTGFAADDKKPLRLPFAYVFSGPAADYGTRTWNQVAVPGMKFINERGGIRGRKLEFYKVDTRHPETAPWITDFRRLAANKDIPIIFPVGTTKSTLAIFDLTGELKMPTFSPASTGRWPLPSFGDWMFRMMPQIDTSSPPLLKKAKAAFGLKRVALVHTDDDDMSVGNYRALRKIIPAVGLDIGIEQTFKNEEKNLSAQVAAIKAADVDAIVVSLQAWSAGTLALQLRERGVNVPIIGDPGLIPPEYWELSKGKGNNTYMYAYWSPHDQRPVVQDWIKLWRETTGKNDKFPDSFITAYFDGLLVVAHVLNNAKDLSRESVRQAFLNIKELETISGFITWNKAGDVERPTSPVLVHWKDGAVVPWTQ
jgi:branched-chain amino acid transport system substrate-binding protein